MDQYLTWTTVPFFLLSAPSFPTSGATKRIFYFLITFFQIILSFWSLGPQNSNHGGPRHNDTSVEVFYWASLCILFVAPHSANKLFTQAKVAKNNYADIYSSWHSRGVAKNNNDNLDMCGWGRRYLRRVQCYNWEISYLYMSWHIKDMIFP